MNSSTGTAEPALFRVLDGADPEKLMPLPASASGWSADQIRGMAVSGALARATERAAAGVLADMRPARFAVDLFRPARVRPTTVSTAVVRQGRRIAVIDAELRQQDRPVARSRTLFARPTATPEGRVWRSAQNHSVPPPGLEPIGDDPRLFYSQDQGWTTGSDSHSNTSQKQVWHLPIRLVEGERLTPFQLVAGVADLTSLVVNWGTAGVQFINADIDLVLSRLPASMEVGVSAFDRSESDGIAVGTAMIFDRAGPFGCASVVAVANPVGGVDPANRHPDLTAFTAVVDGGRPAGPGDPVR